MAEEKKYIVEQTLRDMYLLSQRLQELANDMSEQLSGTARDCMITAAYLSECTSMRLFNAAGALHLDLASWALVLSNTMALTTDKDSKD